LEEREEVKEVQELEEDGYENMPGGKAVAVALINWARAPRRAAEDQTGASVPMSRTP